ncbi:MAG: hypothetical protein RIS43_413 [Actinomycetota bacterium]|jgi:hypothetical protein
MPNSMPVTNWPERIALTVAVVGFFVGAVLLMRRSWRNRSRLQSGIAAPQIVPADFSPYVTVHARYLASTAAGAWLTRIVVHNLGTPARCELAIGREGVAIYRDGAEPFFIPRSDFVDVRSDRAIAGRAFEKDGIVVLTWRLGDVFIDSGFRADNGDGHIEVLKMMVKQESGA